MKPTWQRDTARRIGIAGEVQFTMSRVGQTLHVPCSQCHKTVDVTVRPGLAPNGVAKKMLGAGWTFGHKLKCPPCSGKRTDPVAVEKGKKTWDGTTPEERQAKMAAVTAARLAKLKKEETPVNTPTAAKAELMSSTANTTPVISPSDAARRAHRLLMQALEDYYDDANKRYRPGHSDKKIAEETGASEQHVRETREQYFGPLGEPTEIQTLRTDISLLCKRIENMQSDFETNMKASTAEVRKLSERVSTLCIKNGWAV